MFGWVSIVCGICICFSKAHGDNYFIRSHHHSAHIHGLYKGIFHTDKLSRQVKLESGTPVILTFIIEADVKKVVWEFNDKQIAALSNRKYSTTSSDSEYTLVISNTVKQDTGYYECLATLEDGSVLSGAYYVAVSTVVNEFSCTESSTVSITVDGEKVSKYSWFEKNGARLIAVEDINLKTIQGGVERYMVNYGTLSVNMLGSPLQLYCVVRFEAGYSGYMRFSVKPLPGPFPFNVNPIYGADCKLSMNVCEHSSGNDVKVKWFRKLKKGWIRLTPQYSSGRYAEYQGSGANGTYVGLHISSTQYEDEGRYRCIISGDSLTYCAADFRLDVQDKSKMEISNFNSPTVVNAYKGDKVRLTFSTNSNQVKSVMWSKHPSGALLGGIYKKYNKEGRYILEIAQISEAVSGVYACRIERRDGRVVTTYFMVTLVPRPQELLPPTPVEAEVWGNVNLKINVPAGVRILKVRWYAPASARGVDFKQMRYSKVGPTVIQALITSIKVGESGMYQCLVTLSDGSSYIPRFMVKVNSVHRVVSRSITTVERNDVLLDVQPTAGIHITKIRWFRHFHDGRIMELQSDGVRYVVSDTEHSLLIRYVFAGDTGKYSAHVTAGYHALYVVEFTVNILMCKVAFPNDKYIIAGIGETIELVPYTTMYGRTWYRPLTRSYVFQSEHFEPSARSLVIKDLTVGLSGRYVAYQTSPTGDISGVVFHVVVRLLSDVFTFVRDTSSCPNYRIYKMYNEHLAGLDAERICQQCGGHLPSIHSEEEKVFLTTLARDKDVIVGLRCPIGSTKLQWVGAHPHSSYPKTWWRQGEPRVYSGYDQWSVLSAGQHRMYMTSPNHKRAAFICEVKKSSCSNTWPTFNRSVVVRVADGQPDTFSDGQTDRFQDGQTLSDTYMFSNRYY